jgi:hypothetical protein
MRSVLLAVFLITLPAFANAQAPLRVDRFPRSQPVMQSQSASTPAMVAGGLAGAAIGFVVFGYIGALITDDPDSSEDLGAIAGGIIGGSIGESVLLPTGVHLVNHRRGKLVPSILASSAIGGAGLLLAIATEDQAPVPGIILGLTPIAQVISSILIEKATSR